MFLMLSISYRCIAFALLIYALLKDIVDLPAPAIYREQFRLH